MAMPTWIDPNKLDPTKFKPEQVGRASTTEEELEALREEMKTQQTLARYEKLFNYEPLGGGSGVGGFAAALGKGLRGYDYGQQQKGMKAESDAARLIQQQMVAEYLRNMMKKDGEEEERGNEYAMTQRPDYAPPSALEPY